MLKIKKKIDVATKYFLLRTCNINTQANEKENNPPVNIHC